MNSATSSHPDLSVVRWIDLPSHSDARGVLTSVEGEADIPIDIKRVFFVHGAAADRGGHAHRDTDQVVLAVAGRLKIEVSNGIDSAEYELLDITKGLFVPRMLFVRLRAFTENAVCCVLANTHYDRSRSIRSWAEYLHVMRAEA